MYTPTQNYGLAMPSYGDEADIGVINDMVTAKVDELLFQNRTISAPPFETTEAYAEGDLVVYENVLYRFTADKTAGAWDSSKVVQTSLAAEIEDRGSGASALSDLTDTDIDTPAEGEVLTWDGTAWVNAEGTPSVTKTTTGNPIEISDSSSAPLVKCTTAIQGNQDLHGYDKPWVGGAGKNKVDVSNTTLSGAEYLVPQNAPINLPSGTYTLSFNCSNAATSSAFRVTLKDGETVIANPLANLVSGLNQVTFTLNTNADNWYLYINNSAEASYTNIMLESGSTATSFEPYSNICPITAYNQSTISVGGSANLLDENASDVINQETILSDGSLIYAVFVNVSGYIPVIPGLPITYGSWESSVNPQGDANDEFNKRIVCFDENKQFIATIVATTVESYTPFSISGIIPSNCAYVRVPFYRHKSIMMLNYGTTLLPYQAYSEPTNHTATFSNSIYQGNADFVNGEVTKDWNLVDLGALTWVYNSTYHFFQAEIPNVASVSYMGIQNTICSSYPTGSIASVRDGSTVGIAVNGTGYVYVRDPAYTDAATFKADMNGVQLAYELATATTETITPTNLPIKSLFGYNHIESSTGEMEIEYITGEYQPLVDLIQSSQHVYATTEQVVGKWMDGSDVYERVITFTLPSSGAYTSMPIDLTGVDKVWVVASDSYAINTYNGTKYSSPFGHYMPNPTETDVGGFLVINGASSTYEYKVGQFFYSGDGILTLRYTKATATTRSLSKGSTDSLKADLSEVKGEGEEILKGDEKALKIDESEDTETKETDETEGNADEVQNETVTE